MLRPYELQACGCSRCNRPIGGGEWEQASNCPTPTRVTVSNFSRYQNSVASLPPAEQTKLRGIADLVKRSFGPGCRPIRTVGLVGHADRDPTRERREPGFINRISRERAVSVKHALERLINNRVISSRLDWDVRGAGASRLVVRNPTTELARMRNRRVEIILGVAAPQSNLMDPRIDIFAQPALLRMFKGDPGARADATGILRAVKSGKLDGIYKEDRQKSQSWARKLRLEARQLVPKGQDAALVVDRTNPLVVPPIIVFTNEVRNIASRLDLGLRRAWLTYRRMRAKQLILCPSNLAIGRAANGALLTRTPLLIPVQNVMPPILCQLGGTNSCLVNFPVPTAAIGKPVKLLTKTEARDIVIHLVKQGVLTLRDPPQFDAACKVRRPRPTDLVVLDPPFIDQVEIVGDSPGAKRGRAVTDLDVRMVVLLFYLARMLRTTWGVTEIHHLGIGSSGTHVGRLAMDFSGVVGTISGSSQPSFNGPFQLNVQTDWGDKPVVMPNGNQAPRWPANFNGKPFHDTIYRLDPQQNPFANQTAPLSFLAMAIFRDVYSFATLHCTDTKPPGPPTTIGKSSRFIIHPDHTSPGLRGSHTNHMHFEIPL